MVKLKLHDLKIINQAEAARVFATFARNVRCQAIVQLESSDRAKVSPVNWHYIGDIQVQTAKGVSTLRQLLIEKNTAVDISTKQIEEQATEMVICLLSYHFFSSKKSF